MARLTILLALLAALLIAASAGQHQQKQEDTCDSIMEKVDLSPCEDYIMQRIQQDEEQEDEDEEYVLFVKGIRRHGQRNYIRKGQDYKLKCCDELSEFEKIFGGRTQCMCRAQTQMMQNLRQNMENSSQMEQLKRELHLLPAACGIPLIERIGCPLR